MKLNNHTKKIEYCFVAFLAASIAFYLFQSFYLSWSFLTDDAYITWHYARNLINGQGLRWYVAANPLEGYSNFSWLILAALVIKLGLPLTFTMKWIAIICLLVSLFCLYRCARFFLSPSLAILPVYLFSHYIGVVWWTISGLETSLFIMLILLLNWQLLSTFLNASKLNITSNKHEISFSHWLISCFLLTLLALTRFEGAVWFVIIFTFLCCYGYQKKFTLRQWRQLGIIFFVIFILPYTIYFLWRLYYFQSLLPNSYYCKISNDYYRFYLIKDYALIAFPCLIASLPYLLTKRECPSILWWMPSVIYCLLLWQADPIIAHFNRLFLGAFSLLSLLPVLGLYEFTHFFNFSHLQKAFITAISILIFTYYFIPSANPNLLNWLTTNYQQRSAIRLQVAYFLNQHAAYKARILNPDSGLIPFFSRSDLEFIDSECLNNADLTSSKIALSRTNYAWYLQDVVKPDWVVRSFYHIAQVENELTAQMAKNGFFKQYQLVAVYQSHQFNWNQGNLEQQQVDFTYKIYHRTTSRQK